MQFFKDFPRVRYIFGNQSVIGGKRVTTEAFQDISAYTDIIDAVKDNTSFYVFYDIMEGMRPDQVSDELYGTPIYHWTFYMLNDTLRQQGWPLTNLEIENIVKRDFPHQFIEFREDLKGIMLQNQAVVGTQSAARGIILRRKLDFGQVIIKLATTQKFQKNETVANVAFGQQTSGTAVCVATGDEHLSVHHYEDGSGNIVDIDPLSGPGALETEVTQFDEYVRLNNDLKQIKVLRPDVIEDIVSIFRQTIAS